MSASVFSADGEVFVPTPLARGPWDERALHGGAPAALIAEAFERVEPGAELQIARLGIELLRPVPFAPLSLSTRIVRPGRRVQELGAELHSGDELICRAGALRVTPVPDAVGDVGEEAATMPGPEDAGEVSFSLNGADEDSFAAGAMQMRAHADPRQPGPAQVWMRLRVPLLPGRRASALANLAACADFGNGISAVLPFERFLFINADLTIHLERQPRGDWVGLDARTTLRRGGTGTAESVLHDEQGALGRAFQTLVVAPR